jgi:hypothetical protein
MLGQLDRGVVSEFLGAGLGDQRRTQRLLDVVGALARNPALSFPKAAGTEARLEGTYRLLNNPGVTPAQILAPHQAATAERLRDLKTVIVAHDTTTIAFNGDTTREGLGPIAAGGQGFFAHVSLAITPGEKRLPLGVMASNTWVRSKKKSPKTSREEHSPQPDRESKRWFEQAQEVESRIPNGVRALHVMDREGDAYELLSQLTNHNYGFVVRSAHNRCLVGEQPMLSDLLGSLTYQAEREVPLTRRVGSKGPRTRAIHPPRHARVARLAFAASVVTLKRSQYTFKDLPAAISLNVVHVVELNPPTGEKPVTWVLFTGEPVDSIEEILRVVDTYRARWTIEEFFKALKTGCALPERQLESRHALENALAIFIPIAWRLLLLRALSREEVDVPASTALTETQIDVLRAVTTRPLSKDPSAKEALLAIAALGGHIKNNGEPGWQVIARGYHDLLMLEVGWNAREKCDQS